MTETLGPIEDLPADLVQGVGPTFLMRIDFAPLQRALGHYKGRPTA